MKQQRLDGLADGIFAIVMTLLVIEMHVPTFLTNPSDADLVDSLIHMYPVFISLILSFALLFTYWRAHHFISSVYAKNLTVGLANINALFFFCITLVPFTAHFLGTYPQSQVAIMIYGLNVIAIGFTLYFMRRHVESNPAIETTVITKADRRSGYIRILFPVFSAAVALIVSYWDTHVSVFLFTIAILFNLFPASSNIIHRWLDLLFSDDEDLIDTNFIGQKDLLKDEEYICVPKSVVFDHKRFSKYVVDNSGAHDPIAIGATGNTGKVSKKTNKTVAVTATTASVKTVSRRKKVSGQISNQAEIEAEERLEKDFEQELKNEGAEDVIKKKEIRRDDYFE